MYKKEIFGSENLQVKYLTKVIAFFLLVTKIWSYKTWIADRVYPIIPPVDFLKHVPDFLHIFLFGFSLLILMIILFLKENRLLLVVLFLSELVSCSLDTVRWQPWEFMYLCILLLVIINFRKPKNILFLTHLFLVSVYIFSGLHKLNRSFLSSVWLDVILNDFFGLSLSAILKYKLFFVGLLIPAIELSLAVLLFLSKSKRKISYFLIFIHVSILIIIGPFGLKYNSIIWFWNVAMIAILLIVYAKPIEAVNKTFYIRQSYWLVLWFVMPIFSFFGLWYQYFSSNLYSGKGYQMYICVNNNNDELKPYLESVNGKLCKDKPYIILQNWAMSEIKSAPIPELEVYKKISIEVKKKYGDKNVKVFLHNIETKRTEEL